MKSIFAQTLRVEERVVLPIRKHLTVVTRHLALAVALTLILIWPARWLLSTGWSALIFFGLLLGIFLYVLWAWYRWYFSIYLVTNQRIIAIRQKGFFYRSVRELEYDQVEEIQFEVKGVFGTIVGYGEVIVVPKSGRGLTLKNIPHPEETREQLANTVKRVRAHNQHTETITTKTASVTDKKHL